MAEISEKGHRERLRKRFLSCEAGSRTDESLLELLLTYAIPRKDVQPLVGKLIDRFGDLGGVLSASTGDLCKIEGIGDTSAVLIKLVNCISLLLQGDGDIVCYKDTHGEEQLTFPEEIISSKAKVAKSESDSAAAIEVAQQVPEAEEIPQPERKLFSIAALAEAIEILPEVPDTDDLEEVKLFLRENLHFNSERTRRDYAAYIVKRIFPEGIADRAFREFSAKYRGTQSFRDVCFYRFARSEPLTIDIVLEVLLPAIGAGKLGRDHIRKFLEERFGSDNRNIKNCIPIIIKVLTVSSIAVSDRKNLRFAYRDISILAFAFLIHSEFPQPGMYDIQKVEKNEPIKAMLWNPNQILSSLYELRNMRLINKISEIDSVRQFTTKYTLGELVNHLIDGGSGR